MTSDLSTLVEIRRLSKVYERGKQKVEVLTLMQDLNRDYGKTLIMVTHDPKAAEYAQHTLHLDKGTLVSEPERSPA